MKLILIGAPGAGKGTQAEILAEHFGAAVISTGTLLRDEITKGTELGKLAQSLIDDGNFVPDEVINPIAYERISQCQQNGYILDGYPRNVAQANQFEDWQFKLDAVIYLDVNDDEVVDRLSGRRVCDKCGATFHTQHQLSQNGESCDECDGKLVLRKDDRPETVRLRLDTYRQKTFPVIEFYEQRNLLLKITCVGGIENTTNLILKALEDKA